MKERRVAVRECPCRIGQRSDRVNPVLLIVAGRSRTQLGERFVFQLIPIVFAVRVAREHIAALVEFFQQILSVVQKVRSSERARFLDPPAEGIVAEGCGSDARHDGLC